jgi:hypothetical protein
VPAGTVVLAMIALLAVVVSEPARAEGTSLERAVKATYLYKFAPFVGWPETAFGSPSAPFRVCVAGEDPFGPLLDRAVAGQRIAEHPIEAARLDAIDRASDCHVLFVGGGDPQAIAGTLDRVRGMPVLTVTDQVRDPLAKGIINFVLDSNRVRFEIDTNAATENGLAISSKLLSLAVSVRQRS